MFVASFTLVLPFFPTGTAERVELEGEIATAFTLARLLSHIPLCRGGPADLVIFDIHALQERFYFGDAVCPLFCSGIPMLQNGAQRGGGGRAAKPRSLALALALPGAPGDPVRACAALRLLPDGLDVTIAYPDEGAWKRFHWMFAGAFPEVVCTKVWCAPRAG